MRAGQPFSMRYPLIEVEGSYGNLMESGNWAAPRYTSSRLSQLSNLLFENIDKNTIDDWRDNYDDTEQYPSVLPSKGFYNIVNGTMGIGIGASSSIPAFNLKEVNNALITLLWNPDCNFEDIYCAPDYSTGGILLNEKEVKESLKNGKGKSCKLRSVVEYNEKEKCLVVTEIPYSVYTNTICGELEKILESEENPGIDRFNDLTGATPLIKIYLSKKANPSKVLKYLYKNTSLQYHYGINMTMLEDGRYPKVFTWKEALQSYLTHEVSVYTKGFQFDLNKIKNRIHIIDGLLKAISILDDVIALIKSATDSKDASKRLQENFGFSEKQAKAILEIKLARLAKLEVNKLEKEKQDLEKEKNRIENILQDETLLKKEIERDLKTTADKFGDSRRTQILDIESNEEDTVELKNLIVSLTNKNNLISKETSNLYIQKRGGKGERFKLDKDEYIISTSSITTHDNLLFFSEKGKYYSCKAQEIPINVKIPIETFLNIEGKETFCSIIGFNKDYLDKEIILCTKKGLLKKSLIKEYITNRKGGILSISLEEDDTVRAAIVCGHEPLGILTKKGKFLKCNTDNIRPQGRVTKGVIGISLEESDEVASVKVIPPITDYIVTISKRGIGKKVLNNELPIINRGGKGKKIQKLRENDSMVDFLSIQKDETLTVVSGKTQLVIREDEISELGLSTFGNKIISLNEKNEVIALLEN